MTENNRNNLNQKTKEFSEAIRQTQEFQDYEKANEKFQSDEEAQKLLQDFQEARRNLEILQQGSFSGVEEQKEKTEKLLTEVRKNKVINDWMQSQDKLQKMISELAGFLSNDLGFPFTPPQKGCGCG